jgi:pseudouridine-5'-phosphate glycosidase
MSFGFDVVCFRKDAKRRRYFFRTRVLSETNADARRAQTPPVARVSRGEMEVRASRRVAALAGHLVPSSSDASSPKQWLTMPCDGGASVAAGAVVLHPSVAEALASGGAVVALESTIVSHGMPYPQNLQMAREVEAIVRARGATPATVAIIDGVPRVGLDDADLRRLAELGARARKVSRRDIPAVIARRETGATTVSATALLAARAGVSVFVTGGVGGVHRGGETSMDVSADLTELAKTPVAVFCAGAKSVLDIPRTLEVLETQGVPVVGYGVKEFPAFFSRSSGCDAPAVADSPEQAARLIRAAKTLGLGGCIFAVPIPEAHEATGRKVQRAIDRALEEAKKKRVKGADVTPFLLKRVRELSGGASLEANLALVRNNAEVGADVAVALARLAADEREA